MAFHRLLLLQNVPHEGPGLLEGVLQKRGIKSDLVDLTRAPGKIDLEKYSGLVVFGGPDSANDQTPTMRHELELIKEVLDREIPFLGICLGMQTLVKAAGGKVLKSPLKEVGFRDPDNQFFEVVLTPKGKTDPIFFGLNERLRVFQLHGETVELTPQMALLAEGKFCKNQVVKVGNYAYGIQCHFELTQEMFEDWLETDPDLMKLSAKSLKEDYQAIQRDYENTGTKLIENFLDGIF